ncbi:hypothetical protein [Lichenifustis flavocetrariae]|uniref:Uncharacterized protein n=1 Tax=Lichenifustis flavocetrariae TaxID=2949735 RepID=A0AA41YX54_9HYPH|nr:hypothetical protein [Lichenifustis flavocetrariae]MCW6510214.1 hypothetical protein [Lichenifustis flavocetrariae]
MRIFAAIMSGLALTGFSASATEAATRAAATCASFMQDYPKALGTFRVSFERPLTITRDLFGGDDGIDVHILATNADVDGTLKCKGDAFRRFEVRISGTADAATSANFAQFQQAALSTLFGWDRARSATVVAAMSADADEYLRASIQRGDLYRSGKVEYHQGGLYDLGVIWTEADHTFVVTTQDGP